MRLLLYDPVRHLESAIEDTVGYSEQVRHWSRARAPDAKESRVETLFCKYESSGAVDISHRQQNAQGTSPVKKVIAPTVWS